MIQNKNFSGEVTPRIVDLYYLSCNFKQPQPFNEIVLKSGIRIFPGDDMPRTFINCNLINCEVPPGSTVTNCNTAIIEYGVVSSSEDIIIDGVVIATEETKFNRVHGRYGNYIFALFRTA